MNRFDESFNGIDPESGRPFSFGHPDGVWMVAVIYLLLFLVTIIRAALTLMLSSGASPSVELIAPILVTGALYLPPLLLLSRRSPAAAWWMWALALIYLSSGIAVALQQFEAGQRSIVPYLVITAVVASQFYIAVYTQLLKRDRLLCARLERDLEISARPTPGSVRRRADGLRGADLRFSARPEATHRENPESTRAGSSA